MYPFKTLIAVFSPHDVHLIYMMFYSKSKFVLLYD